jgi:hypothetical protein
MSLKSQSEMCWLSKTTKAKSIRLAGYALNAVMTSSVTKRNAHFAEWT